MISKVTNHFSHSQTCKSIIHYNQIIYGHVNPLLVTIDFVQKCRQKIVGNSRFCSVAYQSIFKVLTYFVLAVTNVASFVTDAKSKCKMTLHSKNRKALFTLNICVCIFLSSLQSNANVKYEHCYLLSKNPNVKCEQGLSSFRMWVCVCFDISFHQIFLTEIENLLKVVVQWRIPWLQTATGGNIFRNLCLSMGEGGLPLKGGGLSLKGVSFRRGVCMGGGLHLLVQWHHLSHTKLVTKETSFSQTQRRNVKCRYAAKGRNIFKVFNENFTVLYLYFSYLLYDVY